jgi:SAM-dependent methyltransferase
MGKDQLESFYRGNYAEAYAVGRDLVSRYDFSSRHSLLDVAGGSGGLGIAITEACPHLRATVVELPTVTLITQRHVEQANATDLVQVVATDVVSEPLKGSFDVAVLKSFIQVLSPDQARRAIANISQVIEPGGVIYIHGYVLDSSHVSPPETVAFNLFFLNRFDEGQAYTEQEYWDWLVEAGFMDFNRVTLPNGTSIIRARKPE